MEKGGGDQKLMVGGTPVLEGRQGGWCRVRRGEARPGHPFKGVGGRRPRRAGGDSNWCPINGAITGVKEGEEMLPS
jgi:hypothetical protein